MIQNHSDRYKHNNATHITVVLNKITYVWKDAGRHLTWKRTWEQEYYLFQLQETKRWLSVVSKCNPGTSRSTKKQYNQMMSEQLEFLPGGLDSRSLDLLLLEWLCLRLRQEISPLQQLWERLRLASQPHTGNYATKEWAKALSVRQAHIHNWRLTKPQFDF